MQNKFFQNQIVIELDEEDKKTGSLASKKFENTRFQHYKEYNQMTPITEILQSNDKNNSFSRIHYNKSPNIFKNKQYLVHAIQTNKKKSESEIKDGKSINPRATLELNESLYKENMDVFTLDN